MSDIQQILNDFEQEMYENCFDDNGGFLNSQYRFEPNFEAATRAVDRIADLELGLTGSQIHDLIGRSIGNVGNRMRNEGDEYDGRVFSDFYRLDLYTDRYGGLGKFGREH